ncbi:MAG: redoxin domain-containing protein, partial [Pseudomonadota bacterium]
MVKTISSMVPLGTSAPDFNLLDPVTEQFVSLQNIRGNFATIVMFISNHCPYVKHITTELAQLGRDYQSKGVGIVAINSNDIKSYPDDSPDNMVLEVQKNGYNF